MPTYYRTTEGMKTMKKRERRKIRPDGEIRPVSETANAVRRMEIATGLCSEEYADGLRCKKPKVRIL